MQDFRLIAILGGSGSGKSALGLELAQRLECEIFSLDSLSIYQEIDIASAKPTQEQLQSIHHYAINVLSPTQSNHAMLFKTLLLKAITQTKNKGKKTLLLIGGSSFYLKSIIEGLSSMPQLNAQEREAIAQKINSLPSASGFLASLDPTLAIHPNDTYRIKKALEIYFATDELPSSYFATHPKEPLIYPIEKYMLVLPRELLRERIKLRTQEMLQNGLLQEVESLVEKYGTQIQPAHAIGVKECIEFLTQRPLSAKPSIIAQDKNTLCELISTHTSKLAKRQNTFNRTQFGEVYPLSIDPSLSLATQGIITGKFAELFSKILQSFEK